MASTLSCRASGIDISGEHTCSWKSYSVIEIKPYNLYCRATSLSLGNNLTGTGSRTKGSVKFGIGYSATIAAVGLLDLNAALKFRYIGMEFAWSLGVPLKGLKAYEGPGAGINIDFINNGRLRFGIYGAKYWLTGSEETLDVLHPKGDRYIGYATGLNFEIPKGYFIEAGIFSIDDYFSPSFRAGKRYYF
jgi:hypothetical protein